MRPGPGYRKPNGMVDVRNLHEGCILFCRQDVTFVFTMPLQSAAHTPVRLASLIQYPTA